MSKKHAPAAGPAPRVAKAPDRLMPLMELARHWGWSRSKLWRLVQRGEIPHLALGPRKDIHFRESQVEAWLEAQTIGAAPAPPPTNTGRNRREDRIWLGLDPDEENPFE